MQAKGKEGGRVGRAVVASNLWRQPTRRLCIYAATRPERARHASRGSPCFRCWPASCPCRSSRDCERGGSCSGRVRRSRYFWPLWRHVHGCSAVCSVAVHAPVRPGQHSRYASVLFSFFFFPNYSLRPGIRRLRF
jgi:hypothetical protein